MRQLLEMEDLSIQHFLYTVRPTARQHLLQQWFMMLTLAH